MNPLTGVNYNFAGGGGALPAGEMAGPALALLLLFTLGVQVSRRAVSPGFWAAATICLTLFISQVLVWITEVRDPGTARYLFPGASGILLLMAEAFRKVRITRLIFIAVWVVALCGLATTSPCFRVRPTNFVNGLRRRKPRRLPARSSTPQSRTCPEQNPFRSATS